MHFPQCPQDQNVWKKVLHPFVQVDAPSHLLFLSMFPPFSQLFTISGRYWTLVSCSFLWSKCSFIQWHVLGVHFSRHQVAAVSRTEEFIQITDSWQETTVDGLSEEGTSEWRSQNDEKLVMKVSGKEHFRQRENQALTLWGENELGVSEKEQ